MVGRRSCWREDFLLVEVGQTWNLSKILHRRIFGLKILHHQFHLISTVLVRKNTKKWVKMEKFTPLAKMLHCRRHWRHGQIPPLCSSLSIQSCFLSFFDQGCPFCGNFISWPEIWRHKVSTEMNFVKKKKHQRSNCKIDLFTLWIFFPNAFLTLKNTLCSIK